MNVKRTVEILVPIPDTISKILLPSRSAMNGVRLAAQSCTTPMMMGHIAGSMLVPEFLNILCA